MRYSLVHAASLKSAPDRFVWWNNWWLYRVKASGGGGLWSPVSVSQLRSCSASDTAGGPVWSREAERIRITAAVSVERTERHQPEKWALTDEMKPAQITQIRRKFWFIWPPRNISRVQLRFQRRSRSFSLWRRFQTSLIKHELTSI